MCLQLLNILFCTLMFSGGLPLVLPLVSIIFTITYWAEKWELLKLSRVPSPYAGDLAALTGFLCICTLFTLRLCLRLP